MTARRPCPPAPGPLEAFASGFDPQFPTLAQRRCLRAYLAGLLLPRDRNKTLTALAGAEPIVQAQAAPVQRLQRFLSEADWDADAVGAQRLALLATDPVTAPHGDGVLVIDDTGDKKDGTATAHVARQYLGSIGKIDNGIVAVTTLWADARVYYPLHVAPYTPAGRLERGKQDPAFRTKPQIALALVRRARAAGIPFRAVVADCFYGENGEFEEALFGDEVPYVLGRKARVGHWAPAEDAHTFREAAKRLPRGAWTKVVRRFTDGRRETWWAAELAFAGFRPTSTTRAVVATTDRATLPPLSTWFLVTNLPRAEAPLAEVVRLYGLRVWVEEGYRRVKQDLGWADFMVRSDRAIRRHWELVCAAFAFCWWHHAHEVHAGDAPSATPESPNVAGGADAADRGRGENPAPGRRASGSPPRAVVAGRAAARAGLAGPVGVAQALLARVGDRAPAARPRGTPRRPRRGARAQPLPPVATKYRYNDGSRSSESRIERRAPVRAPFAGVYRCDLHPVRNVTRWLPRERLDRPRSLTLTVTPIVWPVFQEARCWSLVQCPRPGRAERVRRVAPIGGQIPGIRVWRYHRHQHRVGRLSRRRHDPRYAVLQTTDPRGVKGHPFQGDWLSCKLPGVRSGSGRCGTRSWAGSSRRRRWR
jgi:SRSO17 transposase